MTSLRWFVFALLALAAGTVSAQSITIEVNQAIGVQKNGARKFVAGKDTVVRAFLDTEVIIDESRTTATVIRDGQQVASLLPNKYESATSVVDFLCASREACGNWAAGSYQFDVAVNGVLASTAGTDYRFVERGKMRILALPVVARYGEHVVPVSDTRWKTFGSYVRDTYPIAAGNFEWVIRDDFDASGEEFDLETDLGRYNLWEALAKLIPAHCGANPQGDGCFSQVFGFIQSRPNGYPEGNLQGYTYGPPANIGVVTDNDAAATVAHEIGHTFGLGDTYNGGTFNCGINPAPDLFQGKDWNDRALDVQCTAGRANLENVSGTLVPAGHHPYEIGGRGALGDMAEYMGSGGEQSQYWTTQDAYDHLFDQLVPAPPAEVNASATLRRAIQCFGMLRRNAAAAGDAVMDPCWTFYDTTAIPNTTGRFMMAAVGAGGAQLATQKLDVEFDPVGSKGHAPQPLEQALFFAEMAFPDGTEKIQILSNGTVVAEVPVTAHEPVVTEITITPTESGNEAVVAWNASDQDGGTLSYEVEYNADVTDPNDDWEVVDRDLTDRSLRLDLSDMAGGAHARVRVWVTDGVHTTGAESADFIVPAKPPEAFIDPPPPVHPFGEWLILAGAAFDLQDDEILEENLVWTSNLSGVLGTGSVILADLPKGTHTITLTATNSMGLEGKETVTVQVASPKRRAVRK